MTTGRGDAERFDELIAFVRDEVQPLVDGLPGSLGLSMLVSRETGCAVVSTVWATEQARASSDAVLAPVRARAAALIGGTVQPEELQVAVLERLVPGTPGCWVRLTRTAADPARLDEGVAAYATQVLPAVRALPGFCSAVLLLDPATGAGVGATTWADREALSASAPRAQALRSAVTAQAGISVLDVAEYELVLAGIRWPQRHEELFRRAYAAMSAGGSLDDLDALVADDLVEHGPVPPGTAPGRAGVKALMGSYRQAFPDLRMTMEKYLEQGELGAAVLRITGTHTGPLMGLAPTGRPIDIVAVDVVRIVDGVAVEHWGCSDDLGMFTQLGVAPGALVPEQATSPTERPAESPGGSAATVRA